MQSRLDKELSQTEPNIQKLVGELSSGKKLHANSLTTTPLTRAAAQSFTPSSQGSSNFACKHITSSNLASGVHATVGV